MQYPEADTIHLVMDNLNIHCRKSLTDAFGAEVGNEISRTASPFISSFHPIQCVARRSLERLFGRRVGLVPADCPRLCARNSSVAGQQAAQVLLVLLRDLNTQG
jgi:hypothetical protein